MNELPEPYKSQLEALDMNDGCYGVCCDLIYAQAKIAGLEALQLQLLASLEDLAGRVNPITSRDDFVYDKAKGLLSSAATTTALQQVVDAKLEELAVKLSGDEYISVDWVVSFLRKQKGQL